MIDITEHATVMMNIAERATAMSTSSFNGDQEKK